MKFPKQGKVKLEGDEYRALQQQVFTADNWLCRICNRLKPLQAHHVIARSKRRWDVLENLVSLCSSCHQYVTEKYCDIQWDDVELRTIVVTWKRKPGLQKV